MKGNPKNIEIGKKSALGQGVILNARDKIKIGEGVHISCNSQLHTGYLNLDLNIKKKRVHLKNSIIIENNVWIASGAVIGAGVTIGKNSVVGANSVVTKDIPSNEFWGGVPARKIRDIKFN